MASLNSCTSDKDNQRDKTELKPTSMKAQAAGFASKK
jgi:hypothetical protein